MTPTIAGLAALGLPLLIAGAAILRGRGAIFAFYTLLCAVGLGYLFTTGAVDEIGTNVLEIASKATAEKGAEPVAVPAK